MSAYGFPSWNYGYTLCPQTGAQTYQPPKGAGDNRGKGGGRGQQAAKTQQEVKPAPPAPAAKAQPVAAVAEEKEEGEIEEKSIEEILDGQNPIVFCTLQSKMVSPFISGSTVLGCDRGASYQMRT
jgi:hypothetical protein